ncbi:family 20 glycosylhydrolase [Shewanella woodyi]|uniref:family 20 glycosylhydrolase n=1 Tax=Shewanella woodyi TaxID=60961 RepID=UPI0037491842
MWQQLIIFLNSAILLSVCISAHAKPINIMPLPAELKTAPDSTHFHISPALSFSTSGIPDKHAQQFKQTIQEVLAARIQTDLTLNSINDDVKSSDKPDILVKLTQQPLNRPPQLGDDESYELDISSTQLTLIASNELGIKHGLNTLSQLLLTTPQGIGKADIPAIVIKDKPRYPWRGLLIDSVRHFMPIETIKRQLDGMASAKLNVFHWHLTDDQGWRIESKIYPALHQKASDGKFYTQAEITSIVEYASGKGIRVVPELDLPGHASAIAVAYPELMSAEGPYEMERQWGVFEPILDPTNPEVYQFIDKLVGELTTLFPDHYLHIGGDEVPPTQWLNNENITEYMQKNALLNAEDLQAHFNQKVNKILAQHKRFMMGWDEIFHPKLPSDILVQSWRGLDSLSQITAAGYQGLLSTGFYIDQAQYTDYHYRNDPQSEPAPLVALLPADVQGEVWQFTMPRYKGSPIHGELLIVHDSQPYAYLSLNGKLSKKVNKLTLSENKIEYRIDTWMGPTTAELTISNSTVLTGHIFVGNTLYPITGQRSALAQASQLTKAKLKQAPVEVIADHNKVLGGEATIWSELITHENIDIRVWPRLYAIAERLWSPKELTDSQNMYQRLASISSYSQRYIGLEHKQQQQQGLQNLVHQDNDISPLQLLAEAVEPAHYYTRHHLKFQANEYHQQAPLNRFVDYLDVESLPLIFLHQALAKARDKESLEFANALNLIETSLLKWQKNQPRLKRLIDKSPKLHNIKQVAELNDKTLTLGIELVQLCRNKNLTELSALDDELISILSYKGEIVLASAHLLREVVRRCH